MRRPIVNKPLGIAYGTGELPAIIASSRDYHAYRSQGHAPGDLIPIANANHFTILDELRQPNSTLTRAVLAMPQYQISQGMARYSWQQIPECIVSTPSRASFDPSAGPT